MTLTQTLVDPLILKLGHLPADPTDSEIKDLFQLLSTLHDQGPSNIELIANEFLKSSMKAQVESLDDIFKKADADNSQKIELEEWGHFIKLIEGNALKSNVDIEKHWKNAKSKFDVDFDGALSRAEVAIYLANTHVRAFYFVRREEILQE